MSFIKNISSNLNQTGENRSPSTSMIDFVRRRLPNPFYTSNLSGIFSNLIMPYLHTIEDITTLSVVSKFFRDFFALNTHVSELSGKCGSHMNWLIPRFPNITRLEITNDTTLEDQSLLPLQNLSKLSVLDLTGCNRITNSGLLYLKNLTQLQVLSLAECPLVTNLGISYFGNLTLLAHLDLSYCRNISQLDGLKNCLSLELLRLNYCSKITDLEPLKILPLTKLTVVKCTNIPENNFSHLSGLPLTYLDISYCTISDNVFSYFSQNPLIQLRFSGCQVSGNGLSKVKKDRMESLELSECANLNNSALECLKEFSSLMYLGVSYSNINTDGVQHISLIPQLKQINIEGCLKINDADVENMMQANPKLKIYPGFAFNISLTIFKKIIKRNETLKE